MNKETRKQKQARIKQEKQLKLKAKYAKKNGTITQAQITRWRSEEEEKALRKEIKKRVRKHYANHR